MKLYRFKKFIIDSIDECKTWKDLIKILKWSLKESNKYKGNIIIHTRRR